MAQNDGNKTLNLPPNELNLLRRRGYTLGEQLNRGSFSRVCKATKDDKLAIAVKIIDLEKTSNYYRNRFLPRELNSIKNLSHPFIVTLYDIFTIGNRIYVLMELAEGGDILDLLKEEELTETKAKLLYKQIGDALKYIHSKAYTHRDIKCENVLLNNKRTIAKLADFGFSRTCFDPQTGRRLLSDTYCGSAAYVAPEVLKTQPYNAIASDVWSLGVVLYVLVNNRLPFSDSNLPKMLKKQLEKQYEFANKSLSESCKDLIHKQLEPNIQLRYTMVQVMQHKWLQ